MNFDLLIPYLKYLIIFLIGLTVLYIRTLVTEKAKNRILKRKNEELVNETEQIKAKYTREIEGLRKDHQLDIAKRKYQYESKKEQYLKFFRLLDEFGATSYTGIQEKFLPIFNEFNRNYLNAATKKDEAKATTVFSKRVNQLMLESSKELARIKQETNTIRIIASETLIQTLDLMEFAYDKCFDVSVQAIKEFPALLSVNDQQRIQENQKNIEDISKVILRLKEDMIKQMRMELNEI